MTEWMPKIEQEYGISIQKWESCASDPFANESYRLHSPDGRQYFLKAHDTKAAIQALETAEQLRSNGLILIPKTIPSLKGELLCRIMSRFYSLSPFMSGDPSYSWLKGGWNTEQAYAAGEALALFHAHGKKLPDKKVPDKDPLAELPLLWEKALLKLDVHRKDDPLLNHILRNKDILTTKLTGSMKFMADKRDDEAAQTIIHGDFHPGNVVFAKQKVLALVDLDYCRKGHDQYDLAYALLMFRDNESLPEMTTFLNNQMTQSFLKGYAGNKGTVRQEDLDGWLILAAFIILLWLIDRLSQHEKRNSLLEPTSWFLRLLS